MPLYSITLKLKLEDLNKLKSTRGLYEESGNCYTPVNNMILKIGFVFYLQIIYEQL